MRRPPALLVLLGWSTSACDAAPTEVKSPPPAAPTSSKLYAPDPWKSGETVTEKGTFRKTTYGNVPDGSAQPRPHVIAVDYEVVRRCTEADAAGHWVRGEAWIRRWALTGGPAEDRSIEGAVVALDADGKWRFVDGRTEVSPSAKTWIEQNLAGRAVVGGDGDGVAPQDWPTDEVVVGAAVPVRVTAVERGYAQMGIPFPAAGFVGEVVLKEFAPGASGTRITFSRTAQASLEGTGKSGGKDLKYLPGSTARDTTECTKVLGACHATATLSGETHIVTVVDGGKGPMRSEAVVATTMERRPGGEMPAAKPAEGGK